MTDDVKSDRREGRPFTPLILSVYSRERFQSIHLRYFVNMWEYFKFITDSQDNFGLIAPKC